MLGAWYGVNTAEIRIAHNNLLISREELERITMETVFNVEQAYWEMAFSSRNLEAKVKALAVTQENLDNTRKKEQVGTLAAIAVTTAESQVALRKAELEEASLLAATARDRLLNVINYPGKQSLKERWEINKKLGPYDFINVVCTTAPAPATLPFDRDRALSEAFNRRPEYRQIALNTKNQEIRVDVARNALLPRLDALGRWAQLGLEETFDRSFSELNTGRYYDWLVGVEFSVPLSNRAARSRYRNTRDELRKLKLLTKDLENQIVLEVDNSFRRVASFQRKVADLEDRVRLQIEILQAERRKLEVGRSIPYTVSTIENDLVDNQTQSLRAKADLQTAIAEFFRVTGTLLEQYGIEISPP
jgi:outer membrane protein TolC